MEQKNAELIDLNSISAHNYTKLFLLKVYFHIHKFDIIRLSEIYLNSSTTSDVDNLAIQEQLNTP